MREHIFRGKAKADGKWYYGDLTEYDDRAFIEHHKITTDDCGEYYEPTISIEVDPETIGEYTGISDKNGKKVFEGDIFKCADYDENKSMYGVVKYRNTFSERRNHNPCGFVIEWIGNNGILREDLPFWCSDSAAEKVGNICDNPELLGE